MPNYIVRDENNKITEIGLVKGSLPYVLPPARKDEEFLATSLKTKDILGCNTGTKILGNFHSRLRRDIKKTNDTSDVIGAQSGSLKKSLISTRIISPLDPDY
jgi:hypothetical protein